MATTSKGITYPVGSDTADLATHFYNLATSVDTAIGSYVGSTRNYIINGAFDVWQRGTSFSTANTYTADRWRAYVTTDTFTASRQDLTNGDIPGRLKHFYRISNTTAGGTGSFTALQQRIESARTLAGQSVAVSFWAKSNTAAPVFVEFERYHGSGGGSAVSYHSIGATSNLTTSWVRYTVTNTIGSLSSIAIGTGGDDYLALNIFTSAGSAIGHSAGLNTFGTRSAQVDIAGVQVEYGTVATPYEFRPMNQEVDACNRYYFKSLQTGAGFHYYPLGVTSSTTQWYGTFMFPVPMRKYPSFATSGTFALSNGVGAQGTVTSVGLSNSANAMYDSNGNCTGALLSVGGTSFPAAGSAIHVGSSTTNGYMSFDAEL